MRILITGARSIDDRDNIFAHLDMLLHAEDNFPQVDVLLSGGQKGVDRLVEEYAKANDLPFILFKPYNLLDSKAPHNTRYYFVRNKQQVDNADWVIVFSDGVDAGTEDVINYARKRAKSLTIIDKNQLGVTDGPGN